MSRGSLALRLALGLGLTVAGVFAAMGWALHQTLDEALLQRDRVELQGRAELLVERIRQTREDDPHLTLLGQELDTLVMGHGRLRLWLLDAAGQPLYGGPAPPLLDRPSPGGFCLVRRDDGVVMEALRQPLPIPATWAGLALAAPGGVARAAVGEIVVALDVRGRQALQAEQTRRLFGLGAAGVLVTVLLVIVASWRGLAPLRRLARASAALAPATMAQRLPERHGDPGLDGLARAFNGVLDRQEAAYHQLEAFNADVAHELRTPLATLINGAQVALAAPRGPQEMREVLGAQLEVLEQLSALVKDMLFLARADQGGRVEANQWQILALEQELRHSLDFVEALADDAGLTLSLELDPALDGVAATGHPALLRRAVCNLLSNGIGHSAPGCVVRLRARWLPGLQAPGRLRLEVHNRGEPIPEALRQRMFHRFVRGDPARVRREGHGLGLAIVQAVAQMHGGSVGVVVEEDGLSVGLEWPLRPVHAVSGP